MSSPRFARPIPRQKLADAQLNVARRYGFPSWRRLKAPRRGPAAPTPGPAFTDAGDRRLLQHWSAPAKSTGCGPSSSAFPALVNAVGPHPFWGGRPQALHLAIEGKRRDMFDLLLARGADVNGRNDGYDHWSPLMLAIDRHQADMQADLRRRGATVGLVEALMLGDDGAVDAILGQGPLPAITPNGGSLLASRATTFAVDRLLALGAATDVPDRWGSLPIDAISRKGAAAGRSSSI